MTGASALLKWVVLTVAKMFWWAPLKEETNGCFSMALFLMVADLLTFTTVSSPLFDFLSYLTGETNSFFLDVVEVSIIMLSSSTPF